MTVPWLPHMMTKFMDGFLEPAMSVFEWGSGDSTLWFAWRITHVVSVEHNPDWYRKLPDLPNVDRLLIEPEPGAIRMDKADPTAYYSECLGDVNMKRYASCIDNYGEFDLILVDGRARPSCLMRAHSHVKPGGVLVLDNVERPYYLERTVHLFDGWDRMDVFGHGPQLEYPWRTVAFRRHHGSQ